MAKKERPGYSILVCPDSDLLKEKISALQAAHLPESSAWEKQVFWGDEPPTGKLWDALTQEGLFSSSRIVVARQANLWKAEVWKSLSAALSTPRASIWPFICLEVEKERDKFKIPAHISKSPCFEFADKQGWVWSQAQLEGEALKNYILKRTKELKIDFDKSAMDLFLESVMPLASVINTELKKLALIANGKPVSQEMLSMDFGNYEKDAFAIVKKLETGKLAEAWKEVSQGQQAGKLFFLIAIMARELRLLWNLADGGNPWMPKADAPQKKALASHLGKKGISAAFTLLANAEWDVKSGRQTPEQSLESLCVKLAAIFSR